MREGSAWSSECREGGGRYLWSLGGFGEDRGAFVVVVEGGGGGGIGEGETVEGVFEGGCPSEYA